MFPIIWIFISVVCLVVIVLGWIIKKKIGSIWWLCLGLNLGFIDSWYTSNSEILEHFATKYVTQARK